MRKVLALIAFLVAADAGAQEHLGVRVGETIAVDVGYAMGVHCDDLSIVKVTLRPRGPHANDFVVTGLAEGRTMCRVGLFGGRPSHLFVIDVSPPGP